jgi:tetratricopeptide (TPR) repeat protein
MWFFGRSDDSAMLARLWQNNRLTLMVGEAGRGKTSLLHAGVLPLLACEDLNILPVGRLSYGATFPFAALPPHNPYTLALLRSWSPGETATRLTGLTIDEFIRRQAGEGPVLAAIDSADDLLADAGPRTVHRRQFLVELAKALEANPRLHLLILGREEAIGVVADVLGNGVVFDVPKLTWLSALEALTQPAAQVGRSFADGAAKKLLTDLQTSRIADANETDREVRHDHVEPALLQIACVHLWASLPVDANVITVRHVRTHGNVDGALAAYWGTVIAEVADAHDVTVKRLSAWLWKTFVTEIGTKNKAYEGTAVTAGMPNAVVRALQDRHLLVCQPRSGARWYELLSDRLIEPLCKAPEVHVTVARPDAHVSAAERALARGELDLAERHSKEILQIPLGTTPHVHADACTLLGNIALEREQLAEAEQFYREAAELLGAAADIQAMAYQLAAIGQALVAQGRLAAAVEELNAAADRVPNDVVVQVDLALALWQLGAGQAAVTVLTRALGIDGSNVAALQARGEVLADLGEAREAMRDLDRVNLLGRPSARAARALALAELGDGSIARRELEQAVAEAPRNGTVLLYAARAFHKGGDDHAAWDYARQAAHATDPPLSPRHRELARLLVAPATVLGYLTSA